MNNTLSTSELNEIVRNLIEDAKAADFLGYDPFDGLNSRFFIKSKLQHIPAASIAWLQFHKRCPINLRALVGVRRERNPKGIALFILGLVSEFRRTAEAEYLVLATELADWLLTAAVDKTVWTHFAWGYHFDWAARAFFVPKGKPNAITTCYVARALYEVGNVTTFSRFTEAAVDAGRFLDGLYQATGEERFFAYIPGESAFVHNANLWSASLVAESGSILGDTHMVDRALSAARQSVSMQRYDGAWAYGTRRHHGFIDGFHTGYNLEALSKLQESLGTDEFQMAIENGLNFYRKNFLLPDGTVKYYSDNVWPLDTHSFAEAILTLTNVSGTESDMLIASRVTERLVVDMYSEKKKRFAYQRNRYFSNRINYLRWTQAWAFFGLSSYLSRNPRESVFDKGASKQ
jgi:hypothetical protein